MDNADYMRRRNMKRYTAGTVALLSLTIGAYATNGDLMIGYGARSGAMGGTGIAYSHGSESTLINPALIGEDEFTVSATAFAPYIRTRVGSGEYGKSDSTFYLMPSFAYSSSVDEHFRYSVGVWPTAGMGVDFSNLPSGSGTMKMRDDLMIMDISAALSYRNGGFSIGIAPIVEVGMLDIEYERPGIAGMVHSHPYDMAIDAGVGAIVGVAYAFDMGLTLGASYRTPISLSYDGENGVSDMELEQPSWYGAGISYSVGRHDFAFDWKRIEWSSSAGYSSAGWKDTDIYSIGYAYRGTTGIFRLGYNHGKSPIETQNAVHLQNYMNLLGFPATSEDHFTMGGTFFVDEGYSVDLSVIYSPRKEKSGTILDAGALGALDISNRHGELAFTVQVDYKF